MKLMHTVFYTKDIGASLEFYKKIGFQLGDNFGNFVNLLTDDEGTYLSINVADDPTKYPGHQTVIMGISSVQREFQRLQSLGIGFNEELVEKPFGWTFSIRDPDGNKIEYIEVKEG